ncbi:unnamed protein product [Bursaphelenchus xylophilus]|uniref:(pine wood nematode) hypothetical protein n=1 Tax=Bursaphelenchus xylophilus TaxID=6326 RepID=A0A1I7RU34_BURXY|nr:unnamed protein product [Bursaphelenchus xylophilus]CAG9113768.1 unnamed protein product [Bursaphelenchus xylophilus]
MNAPVSIKVSTKTIRTYYGHFQSDRRTGNRTRFRKFLDSFNLTSNSPTPLDMTMGEENKPNVSSQGNGDRSGGAPRFSPPKHVKMTVPPIPIVPYEGRNEERSFPAFIRELNLATVNLCCSEDSLVIVLPSY